MWIWWIISLAVLIACFIFAYRMIVSSYNFLPDDRKKLRDFKKDADAENSRTKSGEIWNLKSKLQKMEEDSSFHEIQFSKLMQRLKTLEEHYSHASEPSATQKKEEDWEEMYYEENKKKEEFENELDETKQKLEETENKLNSIEENNNKWADLQSDYDARLNDLQSMQNNIGLLQRQLEASITREKELEQSLLSEAHLKNQFLQLQNEYARLQSENEELRRQIIEMSEKEKGWESNTSRLNELESKLTIYEEEKARMIADLELMVNKNKISPSL